MNRREASERCDPPVFVKDGETIWHDSVTETYKVVNDASGATLREGKLITVYPDPPKCTCATLHPDYCEVHAA